MNIPESLRVLYLSAEAEPFIKVGGLGDVAGSLPAALRALPAESEDGAPMPSLDVRLAIPFHSGIKRNIFSAQKVASFSIAHASGPIPAEAYETHYNRLPVYFIHGLPFEAPYPVYSPDLGYDAHKYIFFSLAALEMVRALNWQPDIIHVNDWHAASALYWLANHPNDDFFAHTARLLTLHNLPFVGTGASFPMSCFGLPPSPSPVLPDWARHLPLPLGLLSADHITTVSPAYAGEILSAEFGAGLEDVLRLRSENLSGILNCIDTKRWDPTKDAHLSVNYSSSDLPMRMANKAALLNELGFFSANTPHPDLNVPLLAMVTRMRHQKGIDLALEALERLAEADTGQTGQPAWRAILLGTGQPDLEQAARRLEQRFPEHIRAVLRYDDPLSHRIYAGADVMLIPSRYEPCGLNQMIAMRYGCLPLAHATGGLKDTIRDAAQNPERGTGFLFHGLYTDNLVHAIQHALHLYTQPAVWQAIQRRAMQEDFSWEQSARQYRRLYVHLTQIRHHSNIGQAAFEHQPQGGI